MSEDYEHRGYDNDELIQIVDETTVTIIEGLLIWMDMSENLIEDASHTDECDGKCSEGIVDDIFKVNKDHLDRVVESFRKSLIEMTAIKGELSSDARGGS